LLRSLTIEGIRELLLLLLRELTRGTTWDVVAESAGWAVVRELELLTVERLLLTVASSLLLLLLLLQALLLDQIELRERSSVAAQRTAVAGLSGVVLGRLHGIGGRRGSDAFGTATDEAAFGRAGAIGIEGTVILASGAGS